LKGYVFHDDHLVFEGRLEGVVFVLAFMGFSKGGRVKGFGVELMEWGESVKYGKRWVAHRYNRVHRGTGYHSAPQAGILHPYTRIVGSSQD
jgi:hypothetical protein